MPSLRYLQSFAATRGGQLTKVAISAVGFNAKVTGLSISLVLLEDGQPTETVATRPVEGLRPDGRFADRALLNATADFGAAEAYLSEGAVYGVLFEVGAVHDQFQVLAGGGDGSAGLGGWDSYKDGSLWISRNGKPFRTPKAGDCFFEVTVDTAVWE